MTLSLPGMRPPDRLSDNCYTPPDLVKFAERVMGGIDTDPCWSPSSHVRPRIAGYTHEDDGLARTWHGAVWCNPPYSDALPWAHRLERHAGPALALVKCDPTTQWWSVMDRSAAVLCLMRNRVRFVGPYAMGNSARFASAIFGWGVDLETVRRHGGGLGRWIAL